MSRVLPTILIIDDDLPTLALYERELSRDYRVLTCTNEHAALELFAAENLSAVVVEPAALGERGWSLVTTLKRAATPRAIPIVVCTTQDARRLGLELGASDYLVKPVLPTLLRRALNRVTEPS
ncbi:MAG: response regulator [Anaerolineae bacterium]|nr:response regulator [Anaerolineae bacterium]